jgi:hypothetical protein
VWKFSPDVLQLPHFVCGTHPKKNGKGVQADLYREVLVQVGFWETIADKCISARNDARGTQRAI